MRHITRFAAALALAVPLFAVSGTAQARNSFGFSVTIGSPGIHGGYGYHGPARYRICRRTSSAPRCAPAIARCRGPNGAATSTSPAPRIAAART